MTETERDFGRRWFEEVWNRGRREAIAEMLAPECVIHDGETDSTGPGGFYPFFDRMHAAFSELRVTIQDIIAQDDRVCVRWLCTAKHTGGGLGIPATGKTVRISGITIIRMANEKAVEAWQNWDMLGMMEQLQGHAKAATYIGAS